MKLTRLAAAAGLMIAAGIGGVAAAAPAAAYPFGTVATASINATVFTPGSTVIVSVENATPGGTLSMVFQSSPVDITNAPGTVGDDASGSVSGTIPGNAELGAHTITVNSTRGESFRFAITVVATGGGGGGGGTTDNGGGLASTGAAVTGIGILGGVLVAGGVFFVLAGRRRTASQTPSV